MQALISAYTNEVISGEISFSELDEKLEAIARTEEQIALRSLAEGNRSRREQVGSNQTFLREFAGLLPHYEQVGEISAPIPQQARHIARTVLWNGSPLWVVGSAPDKEAGIFKRTNLMLMPVAGHLQPNHEPSVHSVSNRMLQASRLRFNSAVFGEVRVVKPTTPGSTALSTLDPRMDGQRNFNLDDLTLIRYHVPQHLLQLAGFFACQGNLERLLQPSVKSAIDLQKDT
jgi:hypothetical protein